MFETQDLLWYEWLQSYEKKYGKLFLLVTLNYWGIAAKQNENITTL